MIKCPNCKGELDYNVKDSKITCPYCRSIFDPKELKVNVKTAKERNNPVLKGKSYSCSQCGATLMTFDETAITFCSYCGSQAMIEEKMNKGTAPDFVIPFTKDKETCINEYKKKIAKSFFVPKYMKEDLVIDKFRGIFMPYAIYDIGYEGDFTNNGEKYAYRSGDYKYYQKYKIVADADINYSGISFDISSKFYDKYSNSIPFDIKESKPFNPNYLVSFYADTYDVDGTIYDKEAKSISEKDANKRLTKFNDYEKHGCYTPKVDLDVKNRRIGFFPVYFVAIKDKTNTRVHYVVINGQTGKVAFDTPIDFWKYVFASLIVSIIIFIILNLGIVLTPERSMVLAMGFAIISLIMSIVQVNNIRRQETHDDDLGFKSVTKEKIVKTNKFKYLYKEIIAVLVPGILYSSQLAEDTYYYAAAIISFTLVILSFRDLIKEHNLLSSNKLPQLEKRGGDEK